VSSDPYTVWRHYSPAYVKRVKGLIKERKFDLIHCDILPLANTIRNLKTIPCTLTDHDVSYLKALRISKQSRNVFLKLFLYIESLKLKNFERRIFGQIYRGITVSEIDKKILSELCPTGNFTVIENGVDTDAFKPAESEILSNTLLWVGGFGYSPNREAIYYFLEEIYPLIKRVMTNVKLNIIGGDVTGKLINITSGDPSIKVFGYVDDPVPYIQKATVFIVPILSGSGTRLKTLEAMAAEKAIVTTSVGCEGIEGADKIHYLIADKPEDFANSVVDILKNPDLRSQLGTNARKLAMQKYDWKFILNKLNKFYEDLTAKFQIRN
jgi:glycosyltransferase involved in cell wall biosynthesis